MPYNIYEYPKEIEPHQGSMTIGDLHGNAVKLLHFLVRHQAVNMSKEDYDKFVGIYEKSSSILSTQIEASTPRGDKEIKQVNLVDIKDSIRVANNNINTQKKLLQKEQDAAAVYPAPDTEEFNKLSGPQLKEAQDAHQKVAKRRELLSNVEAEKQNYVTALERITQQAKQQFPQLITEFNEFLSKIQLDKKPEVIRLIGDELADRGNNDYFNLAFMNYFKEQGIELRVNISNHSNDFLTDYEGKPTDGVMSKDKPSLLNLKFLQDNGIIKKEITDIWVEKAYKSSLKVIDYQLTDEEPPKIRLFTHAPIRFDAIKAVAEGLGVSYKDTSAKDLAKTIEGINKAFAVAVKNGTAHELCTDNEVASLKNMSPEEVARSPLVYVIWNRWNEQKDTPEARPNEKKGLSGETSYLIDYFHGHDPYVGKYENVHNLDNPLGKESREKELKTIKEAEKDLAEKPGDSPDFREAQEYLDGMKYSAFLADSSGLRLSHSNRTEESKEAGFWQSLGKGFLSAGKAIADFFVKAANSLGEIATNAFKKEPKEERVILDKIDALASKYDAIWDRLKLHAGGMLQYADAENLKSDLNEFGKLSQELRELKIPEELEEKVSALAKKNVSSSAHYQTYQNIDNPNKFRLLKDLEEKAKNLGHASPEAPKLEETKPDFRHSKSNGNSPNLSPNIPEVETIAVNRERKAAWIAAKPNPVLTNVKDESLKDDKVHVSSSQL